MNMTLKVRSFLLLILLSASQIKSQDFPDFFIRGATWFYSAGEAEFGSSSGDDPVLVLQYSRDTVVNGFEAVVIEEFALSSMGKEWNTPPQVWIMRQDSSKIYQWTDDGFQLLYDFGLLSGSTFETSTSGLYGFGFGRDTTVIITIDSTSTFKEFGLELPQYWSTCDLPYYSGLNRFRIGNSSYLPIPYPLMGDEFYEPIRLRCYKDSFSIVKYVDYPCDATVITSSYLDRHKTNLDLSPNPASTFIKIFTPLDVPFDIDIINVTGRLMLKNTSVRNGQEINVEQWPEGIYSVLLRVNREIIHRRFLKVNR